MFNTYFYLNRSVVELNNILSGAYVHSVYTQEKDKLFIHIPTDELQHRHLVISTDQNEPYIMVKDNHRRAKKNVTDFFEEYLPNSIQVAFSALSDRVYLLQLENSSLFYMVRGNSTNVVLLDAGGNLDYFKKVDEKDIDDLVNELRSLEFTLEPNPVDMNEYTIETGDYKQIKQQCPFITRDMLNEAKARTSGEADISVLTNNLNKAIKDIYDEEITVFYDEETNKAEFIPSSYIKAKRNGDTFTTDNFNEAIQKYVSLKYGNLRMVNESKRVDKYLDKELDRVTHKLNNLKSRIDKGSREEEYRHYGNLLLANINNLRKEDTEVVVQDYLTGKDVKIQLNPKLHPKQNIDYYYEKSRDEKKNYRKSVELYESTKTEYEKLLKKKEEFEEAENIDDVVELKEELNIKTKQKKNSNKMEDQLKLRHFVLDGKYHVYIGRDSKSNDALSVKFAKQNDYWFHARGLPGSHVVLRVDNVKEGVPKNILKNAAQLAAYYSKAKTAGTAPVSYTLAKNVYKKKGMAPGKVMLQKENVLLVKPDIPKNCEQIEDR